MKQKIKEIVESKTKIENISIRSRKQSIVEARVLYSTLCLKHTQDSYERIGKIINRDHSTIVHYKRIYNTWEQLSVLKTTIQKQKEKIDKLQHYEPVR